MNQELQTCPLDPPRTARLNPWPALIICMTLPSLMTWAETRWILPLPEGERSPFLNVLFLVAKIVQFLLPVAFVLFSEPWRLRLARPSRQGMLVAVVFALVVAAGMFVLYFVFLRDVGLFAETTHKITDWLTKFGQNTPQGFLMFAVFISLLHSFLEEYYWRWFVFGFLRREIGWLPAALVSSLAFMSHHVVVLSYYLPPDSFWVAVVPFSLCVAVGGFAWCWIYERSGNLYAAWVSHLLIDAAIMVAGWDMIAKSFASSS